MISKLLLGVRCFGSQAHWILKNLGKQLAEESMKDQKRLKKERVGGVQKRSKIKIKESNGTPLGLDVITDRQGTNCRVPNEEEWTEAP